ncbi:MAG: hypothetical protein ABL866_15010 [Devosia sp.]
MGSVDNRPGRGSAGTSSARPGGSLAEKVTAVWALMSAYGASNVRRQFHRLDRERF